jgi:hypoxanthine phosphoribosyltransferase
MPRRQVIDRSRGVLEVDWPLFGEMSRALALKVARRYDPGAVIAAILDKPFHSIIVSRRYQAEAIRETPSVFGSVPTDVRDRRVLLVDETCDTGSTLRLAVAAIVNAGAADVRTAVGFRTGSYQPDFAGLETESSIVLPWDHEMNLGGPG